MTENWLPIKGYEGAYEVSDMGRVRSLDRVNSSGYRFRGRLLSPAKKNKHGHLHVLLCSPGVQDSRHVHTLVLENLRWDTPRANRLDSVRNGNNPNANKTECPRGHAYSPDNTYLHPAGSRICRECTRVNNRARREAVA